MSPAPPPEIAVSVLIVAYNSAGPLRRCLAALHKSTIREATEILVVDSGSQDDSPRIDAEFPDVTVLRLPRNFGRTKARNIGARTAKGDYLFLVEPHVEVEPGTVAALIGRLTAAPEVWAVCPLLVGEGGAILSEAGSLPTPDGIVAQWREGVSGRTVVAEAGSDPIPVEYGSPDAVLVRRQLVKGMNYFDQRYGQFGADLELFTQIRRAGKRAEILPAVRVVSRPEGPLLNPADPETRACLSADRALGSAVWVGKHYGWWAGIRTRLRIILTALLLVAGFSDLGYRIGVLTRVVKGEKVDGFQRGL
jgi:GT2 family glycosyltransferase